MATKNKILYLTGAIIKREGNLKETIRKIKHRSVVNFLHDPDSDYYYFF